MKKQSTIQFTQWLVAGLAILCSFKVFADIRVPFVSTGSSTSPSPSPSASASGTAAAPASSQNQEQTYVILDKDMSAIILASTQFQKTTTAQVNNSTGQCSTQEKIWSSGQQAIVCRATTSCKAITPACAMTFPAESGKGASDFVSILGQPQPSASPSIIPGPNH